jgi:hypothetical protein
MSICCVASLHNLTRGLLSTLLAFVDMKTSSMSPTSQTQLWTSPPFPSNPCHHQVFQHPFLRETFVWNVNRWVHVVPGVPVQLFSKDGNPKKLVYTAAKGTLCAVKTLCNYNTERKRVLHKRSEDGNFAVSPYNIGFGIGNLGGKFSTL